MAAPGGKADAEEHHAYSEENFEKGRPTYLHSMLDK
jgi:hypothetical protein